uniref:SH3 domain-containing protein n=1 Tax=Amphimedon queenslandica TaxID=400682 RepID=A0A1X7T3Z1_AMPQE
MFSNVRKVIFKSPPPLKDLLTFIEDFNSDLEAELSVISDLQDIMRLIRKNCCLINIVILEAVVEHFEINDAQTYIDDYKREIKEFCRNLSVDLCLNEPFDVVRASPPLKCETATYVLGWEATEHKLKDVTDIVSKSSGKFVKLISIKSTQSITITCSFPHSLTEALIIKLSETLELLIKNDLMKLTVGYCTIWKKHEIHEIQESLEEEVQEIKEQDKDHDKVNKPIANSVFIARYGYHAIDSVDISFSEEEQLEIYEKEDSFYWKGRSLVSGDEGDIPSSCVYSMLESLQLLEFILSVEEVSLPILQKIRDDSCSNDEKASLFLETINDDPIMISALRQDKEQHDKGVTGNVDWGFDRVSLTSPSPVQCNE